MISVRCDKCGHRFEAEDAAEGLSIECPGCGQEVVAPTRREQEIPLDTTVPPPVREQTVIAEPLELALPPVSSPEQADQALLDALGGRLRRVPDTIQPPATSFARDVWRTGRVVLDGANRHMPLRLVLVDLILLICVMLTGTTEFMALLTGRPLSEITTPRGQMLRLLFPFVPFFVPLAWHCAVYLRACDAACTGDDELALHGFERGVWEDLFLPFGRLAAALAAAGVPAWLYLLLRALGVPLPGEAGALSLLALLLLLPATILVVTLAGAGGLLSPARILRVVFRIGRPYLIACAALLPGAAVLVGIRWLAGRATRGSLTWPLTALYLSMLLLSALGLIAMRIIGLLYRHYKARMPFPAE